MSRIISKLSMKFNEHHLYAVYELIKVKSHWFDKQTEEIVGCLKKLFFVEMSAKSKSLLGKAFGLMVKKDHTIVRFLME